MEGAQTVRLSSPGSAVLKTPQGTVASTGAMGPAGKQIIVQGSTAQAIQVQAAQAAKTVAASQGGANQPQIVTLVKTSQGMTVATVSSSFVLQRF